MLWGRAWEAGGAPPYWPWLQVLRALLQEERALLDALPRARVAPLFALLPELVEAGQTAARLEPAQERFALLDAAATVLAAAARTRPRLLLLEDLHAADPASIELLEFVAGQTRALSLVIVATYREVDAARADSGPLLARVAVRARTLPLLPLSRAEVARQLETLLHEPPAEGLLKAVHAATEGNPLFVVETARLLKTQAGLLAGHGRAAAVSGPVSAFAIPSSVRAVIRQRLATLAPRTRAVLDLAAVVGREFTRATLARLSGEPSAELAVALADAIDAAVVLEIAPGTYRFGHILTREVLHQDLAAERRERLHLELAGLLASAAAPASELAHHYLEAGAAGRGPLLHAARAAAAQAEAQFAFGEAARLLGYALEAHEALGGEGLPEIAAIELRVRLGHALVQSGESALGKARCIDAAERARAAQQPELIAAAALACGSVFVVGNVDAELVALLRGALEALDPAQKALRARVMARLSAALQPAADPSVPIALARESIALARTVGDDRTLLEVLRGACSAMMDLGDAHERLPLNLEHVAIAERLRDRVELLRGTLRSVFDHYELADLAQARAAIDRCERIAGELGHPHYAWRIACVQAMRAAFAGDFAQVEREMARAATLGERAGDPNVRRTLLLQRLGLLRQQGRRAELDRLKAEALPAFEGEGLSRSFIQMLSRSAAVRAGGGPDERDRELAELTLSIRDQTLLEPVAELVAVSGDAQLIATVAARVMAVQQRFAHGGLFGMTWDGPYERSHGLLAMAAGRHDEAEQAFARALERVEQEGARTHLAWTAYDYGRLMHVRGEHTRAAQLWSGARDLAEELAMPDLLAAIHERTARESVAHAVAALGAPPSTPPTSTPPTPTITPTPTPTAMSTAPGLPRVADLRLELDGEIWLVKAGAAAFRLKDSKGLRMLAQLVRERGRELHVLELMEPGGALDTGDAGEQLDPRARNAYRARIESLREELSEAEANSDLGRAEHCRTELELLGKELARAVGLGGRDRKSAAAAERARVNVQRRLKDAIRRIGEQDQEIERHLNWAVKTGTFCSYDPT